jgi:hypothetical protein
MGLFSRRKSADGSPGSSRAIAREAEEYLVSWIGIRHGVEIYTEPKTSITGPTMLLVAHDGEFTRRPVRHPEDAEKFAREHALPIYDATVVGYPQRMRDYSRKQTILKKRHRAD